MAADDDDYLARMMAMRYMYDDDDADYDDSCVEFSILMVTLKGKMFHGAWIMVSFKFVMDYGRGLGTMMIIPKNVRCIDNVFERQKR